MIKKNKTKIISVLPVIDPYVGGCASYSEILMKGFDQLQEIDSHLVLTEYHHPIYKRNYRSLILRILPRRRSLDEMSTIYSYFSYVIYRLILSVSIIIFRIFGYRKLHIHTSISTQMEIMIANLLGYKVVADVRDMHVRESNISGADATIACSIAIHKKIDNMGFDGINKYIPIPVNFSANSLDLAVETTSPITSKYIMYLGVISRDKGVECLLRAFKKFKNDSENDIDLLLAGPLQEPDLINGTGEDVIYVGKLEHHEAIEYIKSASLLVVLGKFEGLPRVCLEAILNNTPFIVNGGVEELEIDCPDCIVNTEDEDSILKALKSDWSSFGKNKLDLNQYDSELIVKKTSQLFRA